VLDETGLAVCSALGIRRLYAHQVAAIEAVRGGEDVVLGGGSASGKSLAFQIPAVERALADPPGGTLMLCPFKPVGRAQKRSFLRIVDAFPRLRDLLTVYDGDLSPALRVGRRGRPIMITNPDMLHRSILPAHPRWASYFHTLRMVVLEELHAYSGLFGANVACLLRRLRRVCSHYGADPQFVCTTSTLSNPFEHARRLTDRGVRLLDADASPRGRKTYVFWRPTADAPTVEAGRLLAECVLGGTGAIAFSRARVACELIAEYGRRSVSERGASPERIFAYRGGLQPQELRALEESMHAPRPVGVATTNLLELGLDLPALEVALICGWPGSLASFFQQAGRVGRSGEPSLVVFVSLEDPVNSFLMGHPEYVFERPFEPGVVERDNPHVLAGHLRCAAQELPLRTAEVEAFGSGAQGVLGALEDRRKVYLADDLWHNAAGERPAHEMPLRGYFDRNVLIQEAESGRLVGEVDWLGAHSVVHPQAIYLHEGRQYLVRDFDREKRRAMVTPVEVDYYTNPLGHSFVEGVDACLRETELPGGGAFFGEVTAGAITTGFERRRLESNELIDSVGMEMPPVTYETMGLWLCLSPEREAELSALGLTPDYYGLGNALRIVLPLFMTCDVLDLRPWSGQTNFAWEALYFYERYPRGLGFTERVFDALEEVMGAVEQNLADCGCDDGCPQCVGDPVRPFMVNNPELEADFIPSRSEVRLLLACIREAEPVEALVTQLLPRNEADELLRGRRELLQRRREEARRAPRRVLPSDAPAYAGRAERRLPLQLERGVRRRIEKMRTPEERAAHRPVRRAAIPPPEPEETLHRPDPAMRRGTPERKKPRPTDAGDIAAEAVRRMRSRRKREEDQDDR
jgi:DEAD/DEAH box helicase domain-containing protein